MKQMLFTAGLLFTCGLLAAQNLTMPAFGGNFKSYTGTRIGITDIKISWDAPGVKGREGKIWGTPVAHYGFQNLGFGTAKESPWRAGANENTTMSFSTDVLVEGKPLPAGKYGFHIAVYADSCTLIFSKNSTAWGSFFYDAKEDALRVSVRQEKNMPASREWLGYEFSNPTASDVVIALEWERWRIPFRVSVDLNATVVASLRRELQGDKGFIGDNWNAAAGFCLAQNYNLEEALLWANNSINPPFGAKNFANLQLKSQILEKLNRKAESDAVMKEAMNVATVLELHNYGRQLITSKQPAKALEVFELNAKRNPDVWPVHVGLARGYSAAGDLKKALEHAKIAQKQAPDDLNRTNLEGIVKTLSEGKAIPQ